MKNFGSGSVDRISATRASKLLTLGENGVENLCARRLQVGRSRSGSSRGLRLVRLTASAAL